VALAACGTSSSGAPLPQTSQRVGPEAIFTPGTPLKTNPAGTLDEMRRLGVTRVRLFLGWSAVAPDATSTAPPAGFKAANPAAYPAAGWSVFDTIIQDALARGIGIDLTLGPPPPRWAEGPGAPQPAEHTYWKPSASAFAAFVHAVGTRYSGHYTPAGASTPLPRVGFWSIWNEPNLGVQLAPQATRSQIEISPAVYRGLVDAAWKGLHQTGHGSDTILIGEVAPAGATFAGAPGSFGAMAPLRFLRALYCVGANYSPLRGAAAYQRQCPITASASSSFAAANPGLFHATAFADHPYPQGLPPDQVTPGEPDYAELAEVPKLEQTLDRLQRVYGSSTKFPIYSTEFGYQTTPPDTEAGTVNPTTAAAYLNWSEYLTWRDPRMRSYDQYLIQDTAAGNFATGLEFANGTPKPGFAAYRMPIFLPVSAIGKGHALEVWGCVRPAHNVERSTHTHQRVRVQFKPATGGPWSTVLTAPITNPHGYVDLLHKFPASGAVRLLWSYPHGPRIFSRTVPIRIH
jgi:hypothetical protein